MRKLDFLPGNSNEFTRYVNDGRTSTSVVLGRESLSCAEIMPRQKQRECIKTTINIYMLLLYNYMIIYKLYTIV